MLNIIPNVFRAPLSIPELDFAGTIASIHPSAAETSTARGLAEGDEIFGSISVGQHVKQGAGALASFIAVPADSIVKVPGNMPAEQAAGLGVSGCTALMLVEQAKVKAGERVLVNGASGGIGTMVIQMVRRRVGPKGVLVGVCSGRNADLVKDLGADEV